MDLPISPLSSISRTCMYPDGLFSSAYTLKLFFFLMNLTSLSLCTAPLYSWKYSLFRSLLCLVLIWTLELWISARLFFILLLLTSSLYLRWVPCRQPWVLEGFSPLPVCLQRSLPASTSERVPLDALPRPLVVDCCCCLSVLLAQPH